MDRPPPTATRAIIQLGQQLSHIIQQLEQHRTCYDRADNLAWHMRLRGHQVDAHPPKLPLADIAPRLIAKHVTESLLTDIHATGHHVFRNGDRWQINPPAAARDGALSFYLMEAP